MSADCPRPVCRSCNGDGWRTVPPQRLRHVCLDCNRDGSRPDPEVVRQSFRDRHMIRLGQEMVRPDIVVGGGKQ